MAKQKKPLVGIVAVVGLMVLILATGSGFFKNFSVQNNGLDVSATASMTGATATIDYSVTNYVASSDLFYTVTTYLDGAQVDAQVAGGSEMTFWTGQVTVYVGSGEHTLYVRVDDASDADVWGRSADLTVNTDNGNNATPTPTPHVTPTPNANPTPTPIPIGTEVTLTISVSGGRGTTNWAPGNYQVQVGSLSQITAIPDKGYHVDKWTSTDFTGGGIWSTANMVTFIIHGPTHITVSFNSNSGTPTPTPTPYNGGGNGGSKSVWQQIVDFFNRLFQPIIDFLKGLGLRR